MFPRSILFVTASFTLLVAGISVPGSLNTCSRPTHCCRQFLPSDSTVVTGLGIDLSGAIGTVGLGCNPASVVGVDGSVNCGTRIPACCTGFAEIVATGCTPRPINIDL